MSDPRYGIYVVSILQEYRNIFSDDWAHRFFAVTSKAPRLDTLALDLVTEWRASVYAMSMPPAILDHIKAFYDGFFQNEKPNTNLLNLATQIPKRLVRKVPELTGSPELIRKLEVEIVRLGAEINEISECDREEFDIEKTWREYLGHHVFQLALWGSQRNGYLSIFNSYESFLLQCVKARTPNEPCRVTRSEFKRQLTAAFGEQLLHDCWTCPEINIAKLARHAISHAGGRVTDDLSKQKHGLHEHEGRIQITPADTKALLGILKQAAMSLAIKAADLSEFSKQRNDKTAF